MVPFKRKFFQYFEGRKMISAAIIATRTATIPIDIPATAPTESLPTIKIVKPTRCQSELNTMLT